MNPNPRLLQFRKKGNDLKLDNLLSGKTALYFIVGYYGFLSALLLLYTVKTPLYSEISDVLKFTPLSSLIAASPFVVLLGIFINQARMIFNNTLLHKSIYQLENLPSKLRYDLKEKIALELNIEEEQVDLKRDSDFENAKLMVRPDFDEYSLPSRWLHDFLDCTFLISLFSLVVLGFRYLAYSFGGLEWALLVGYFSICVVAYASKPKLRRLFSLAESAEMIRGATQAEKTTS